MTTYWKEQNKIWCGCFTGTLEQFEAQIAQTYKPEDTHYKNYMAVVELFRKI
jgi:hypothetical protein